MVCLWPEGYRRAEGHRRNRRIRRRDHRFLRQALEEQKLVEGEESQYGLYVKTVNGVTADEAKEEWWCFTKDGEDVMTGVDSTPVADGDHFEITLKTGY